jgi:hypothetical protein
MKTNDIFNFRRFGKYFVSDFRSCAANYWLSMLLISIMGLVIYTGTVVMGLAFTGEWEGPDKSFRLFTFGVCMFVLMTTMPVKCYGKVTEKKFGTSWLMIPVSTFEKMLSMVLITIFAAPIIGAGIYLCIDALLCSIDKTCGSAIIQSIKELFQFAINISLASESDIEQFPALANFIRQISNPWLYVDDIIGISLWFLAGAVVFKSGKTAKTILAFIAVSMVLSMAITPFMSTYMKEVMMRAGTMESKEVVESIFKLGIMQHGALIDTINDTVANLAMLTCIFLRIKTLKH